LNDETIESVDITFTREEPLWKDRLRSKSLTNAKECNDIVRQFLLIDFDESMISTASIDESDVHTHKSVNSKQTDEE